MDRQKPAEPPQQRTPSPTSSSRWENGRRLLSSRYVLPVDAIERERLDAQHYLVKATFGEQNYHAALTDPQTILDVACGTGVWACEMAGEFKEAHVVGFDIDEVALQVTRSTLGRQRLFPANLRLFQADALQRWPFEDASFDFVFARFCSPFVPVPRWDWFVAEVVRVTRQDGWIELVDSGTPQCQLPDGQPSQALATVLQAAQALCDRRHLYLGSAPMLAGFLRAVGLQDIQEEWARLGKGEQQQAYRAGILKVYEGIQTHIGRVFSEADYASALARLKQELAPTSPAEAFSPICAAWGRKP
jgi:ubiquinone/menaquinone biosynthesis C-methylase UbiE